MIKLTLILLFLGSDTNLDFAHIGPKQSAIELEFSSMEKCKDFRDNLFVGNYNNGYALSNGAFLLTEYGECH